MKKLVSLLVVSAATLLSQTAETIPFRAVLLPSNEVPAIDIAATGAATVWLHVVRDAQGRVTSASTDFNVTYAFPGEIRLTGLHIHSGAAGANGPVLIDSGIRAAEPVVNATGRGTINRQGQTLSTNVDGLAAVNGVLANPAGYYVNLHSSDNPGGVIRGQLERAEMVVLMGQMSPANEFPPIPGLNATGSGLIVALATCGGTIMRDCTQPTSGQVIFDANYAGFPEGTMFTGFHIHDGAAGGNGPVTINTGMQSGANAVPANVGGGNLHYEVEVPVTNAGAARTLAELFRAPQGQYINLHTSANPGGAIRAQLRNTDRMQFSVNMTTANEVPAINLDASAPAVFTAHTIRNEDGSVAGGVAVFDVNYRFPADATFTGLHIHNERAGTNGPVTINTGLSATNSVATTNGVGNIYRIVNVSTTAGVAALNSLSMSPEAHYLNLHTTANPGGVVRAQLADANSNRPTVTGAISAVSDAAMRTVAPGGLMTIFGSNFAKTSVDIGSSFAGMRLPTSFNGVSVTVGGKPAALLIVQQDYMVVQVPTDVVSGNQPVVVKNANGEMQTASTVMVANVAPALYFGPSGGLFSKLDYTVVDAATNPVRSGDLVWAWGTGFGALTGRASASPLVTGDLPALNALYDTAPVRLTVGGRDAEVTASVATPGYAGLVQVLFRVPEGLTADSPVVVTMGSTRSNTVMLPVR
jgi:uncharacterized protein (TIGR03437 family)